MKKIIILLLLSISPLLNAQYTVTDLGRTVTADGRTVRYSPGQDSVVYPTYYDDFDSYANASILAGQGFWMKERGVMKVYKPASDGEIYADSISEEIAAYYNASITSNQYSQITTTAIISSIATGPAVRCQGGTGYYYGWYSTPTTSYLFRVNDGVFFVLTTGNPWTVGDVIKLGIEDYTLYCYKNGILDASIDGDGQFTDGSANKLTNGYAGIVGYSTGTTSRIDDWSGGTFDYDPFIPDTGSVYDIFGMYVVDSLENPVLLVGDTPWYIIQGLSRADAITYLDNRQAKGINTLLVLLIGKNTPGPLNRNGDAPFTTTGNFSTPNEDYFLFADTIMDLIAERNMIVFLVPAYLGYMGLGTSGWYPEVNSNGDAVMNAYGQYVGNRYKDYDNIIWVTGGDYIPHDAMSEVRQMVAGIRAMDTNASVFCAHNGRYESGFIGYDIQDKVWMNLNTTYSHTAGATSYLLTDYYRDTAFVYIEGTYENMSGVTAVGVRGTMWWPVLMGSTGFFYGNLPMYNFTTGWADELDSQGANDVARCATFFNLRKWYNLVPDNNHSVVTAGYGVIGTANYVSAARMSDGSEIIVYIPISTTITVDMSKVTSAGGGVYCQWYNPSTGGYTQIGTYANSGTQNFTSPTSTDWVLVLEAAEIPLFRDNFDSYANSSTLAGQGYWSQELGTLSVYKPASDGEVYSNSTSANIAIYYNVSVAPSQYSQVTSTALETGKLVGPAVRCQGGTGSFYGWYSGATTAYLFRVNNGSFTLLASGSPWTVGNVIKLGVDGYTLYCFRNGVLDASIDTDGIYTDASASKLSNGYVGIGGYDVGTGSRVDDWSGGEFDPPAPETDYTVIKQVTFAEQLLGANTLTRARAFMESNEIQSSWAYQLWDSTVVTDHDTVWKTYIPPVSGSTGTQWTGKMKLNGTDYSDDTLTYARLSFYMKLDGTHWDWSNGGKSLGLSGDGTANNGSELPQGGVWAEGCSGDGYSPIWTDTYGFSGTGGFDGPLHDGAETFGIYTYFHNMPFNSCANLSYGVGWYMDGTDNTTNLSWAQGVWYKISIGYKLNSVASPGTGNADGIMTWSRNDTCYGVKTGIIMRNYETVTIDQWSLKSFHGGGDDATRTDENYVYYDDITLWQDNDFTLPTMGQVETIFPSMSKPQTSNYIDFQFYVLDSVLAVNFENDNTGPYYEAELVADFNQNGCTTWGYSRGLIDSQYPTVTDVNVTIESIPACVNGEATKAMKILHRGDRYGFISGSVYGSGAKMLVTLPNGLKDVRFSYNILLKTGTDFAVNGKWPGITGGENRDGDAYNDDFRIISNFFGDKNNIYPYEGGHVWYSHYIYQEGDDGDSQGAGYWNAPDGSPFQRQDAYYPDFTFDVSEPRWYNITIRVSMNDDGVNNGVVESFINGHLASSLSGFQIDRAGSGRLQVDCLSLYYFYGGNSPLFAPPSDQWINVDDVYIYTVNSAYPQPAQHQPSPPGYVLTGVPGFDIETATKIER